MTATTIVGSSVPRPDAYEKVRGGRGFTVNVNLPGMLHGKMLRSIYPHARIRSIDTSKAESLPGVKAVLSPFNVPAKGYSPIYIKAVDSPTAFPHVKILDDVVRMAGQPVAAVAATSVEIAEEALALIEVDYQELPAVFDVEQAMTEGAPQLHEEFKNNICMQPLIEEGDLDAGFAAADHVFENTYQTHRVHTCHMEGWVCVADADANGGLSTVQLNIYSVSGRSWPTCWIFPRVKSLRSSRPMWVVALAPRMRSLTWSRWQPCLV